MAAMREVPAPTRGSGPVTCCGGHRERCVFGRPHFWALWYENAKLQRTRQTFYCSACGGVCTAEEEVARDETFLGSVSDAEGDEIEVFADPDGTAVLRWEHGADMVLGRVSRDKLRELLDRIAMPGQGT